MPIGAGTFSFTPAVILVTQSGSPTAARTTRAHIYVDMSGGHDTGLAIVNPKSDHEKREMLDKASGSNASAVDVRNDFKMQAD